MTITTTRIRREYFNWMCNLILSKDNILSYRKLLKFLNQIPFDYTIPMDRNRAIDGIDFRYKFGYECNYNREDIEEYLDGPPCSVLEMMVALSYRVEESIMVDPEYGDRTGQWFWNMIVSLGLGGMDDIHFDRSYCIKRISIFLERDYDYNGAGGLFTLEHPFQDMRMVDIWTQFSWYLDENFDFSLN